MLKCQGWRLRGRQEGKQAGRIGLFPRRSLVHHGTMWEWPSKYLNDRTLRFHVATRTRALSWGEVLALWTSDPAFCDSFVSVLAGAPWDGFRWETPPLLERDLDEPFEFVIIASPEPMGVPDPTPFAEHFRRANQRPVVDFPNLGGECASW